MGLEPTGDFYRTITPRLLTEGFQVVSISSLALSRFREARFGNWDKNDPKDAQVMLAMMAQGFVQIYWDPLFSGAHGWQELSNTYFQLTLARTRLQHSFSRITCRYTFQSLLGTGFLPEQNGSFAS